ncbi:MAG: phage holin family protein [Bdellovibrionales bacterium]|nr:phage holin family protein [Bdellovibrionales bacterium]
MREMPATSYASALRDVVGSAKDLLHSEVGLVKAELSDHAHRIARHSARGAIFGALVALSVIPFMAFLVIGLGELLDGRYWLSSLIIAVIFGAGGATLAYQAYQLLKEEDFSLPRARRGLERQMESVQEKVQEIKTTVKGEANELNRTANDFGFGQPGRAGG